MFNKTETETNTLDDVIAKIRAKMMVTDPTDPTFEPMVEYLNKLYKSRSENAKDKFSRDQMLAVGANLLGVVLILNYERLGGIMTSKAVGFLAKSRT